MIPDQRCLLLEIEVGGITSPHDSTIAQNDEGKRPVLVLVERRRHPPISIKARIERAVRVVTRNGDRALREADEPARISGDDDLPIVRLHPDRGRHAL